VNTAFISSVEYLDCPYFNSMVYPVPCDSLTGLASNCLLLW